MENDLAILSPVDLFSGAGRCSAGYREAGFHCTGVDSRAMPRYFGEFIQVHCMDVLRDREFLNTFDVVHASPPCQAYSVTKHLSNGTHAELVPEVRRWLAAWGGAYVIENVPGAPLVNPVRLCGSSFGLDVRRHRLFESNMILRGTMCRHGWQTPRFNSTASRNGPGGGVSSVVSVCGNRTPPKKNQMSGVVSVFGSSGGKGGVELWRYAMGIHFMTRSELAQAIPPAYTEYLGRQMVTILRIAGQTGKDFRWVFPSEFGVLTKVQEAKA